jgi:hypothetical protein
MRAMISLTLILMLGLSGCAKVEASKFNPLNWFGRAQPAEALPLFVAPTDDRVLVAQVLTLSVDKNPGGAIVRATGLPPSQGWWNAELVEVDQEDVTKIVLEFRLFPPVTPAPSGTQASREITVATSLSNVRLDGVRSITVQGQTNALSTRR